MPAARARAILCGAILVMGVLASGPAWAEPVNRELIRAGERAFARGRFEEALEAFREAYDSSGMNAILYNIGMCEWELDRPVDAVNTFRRYMAEAESLSDEDRRDLEEVLDELRPHHGDLLLRSNEDGALVTVDGVEVGRTPLELPLAVAPGEHQVRATAEGFEPVEVTRAVEAGATAVVTLRFLPVEAEPEEPIEPPDAEPTEPPPPPPAPERRPLSWVFWAGVGLAGATALATAITGGLTLSLHGEYLDGGQLDVEVYESGRALAIATDALLGVTIGTTTGVLIGLVVHLVVDRRRRREARREALLTHGLVAGAP